MEPPSRRQIQPSTDETPAEHLTRLLRAAELRFLAALPRTPYVALLELCREADLHFLMATADDVPDTPRNTTIAVEAMFGWNKVLSLVLGETIQRPLLVPSYPSTQGLELWAHDYLRDCGRVAFCESLLRSHRDGLYDLRMEGSGFHFSFPPALVAGAEYAERKDWCWLLKETRRRHGTRHAELDEERRRLTRTMTRALRRSGGDMATFDASPEINAHFREAGLLTVRCTAGWDAFDEEAQFDGVPFHVLRSAAALVAGWGLRHVRLCEIFSHEYPTVPVRNILARVHGRLATARHMAATLGLTVAQGETIASLLTLDRTNVGPLTRITGGPRPPFIEIADAHVIHSLAGSIGNPLEFLLRSLRERARADWDRNLAYREAFFRSELRDLLAHGGILWSNSGRSLRDSQLLTDIDAFGFDPRTGTMALFQLKWQETFGYMMRERASRRRNIVSEGNRWIETVLSWLAANEPVEIARALTSRAHVRHVRLFVLGRHFSHFSHPDGTCDLDDRAAWGNWGQLVRLCTTEGPRLATDPFGHLDEMLRLEWACRRIRPRMPREHINVGDVHVTLERTQAPDVGGPRDRSPV